MTRLSPAGRALLVVAVLCALMAWRFNWHEMWAPSLGFLVALVLGWVATRLAPKTHGRRGSVPDRVEVGERLQIEIVLANPNRRRQAAQRARDLLGGVMIEVDVPPLDANSELAHRYEVAPNHRGRMALGPLLVDNTDPLGLFEVERVLAPTMEVVVHPRHHPLSSVAVGGRRGIDGPDAALAEGSITFHTLRDYVPGDDLRRVHWRSSARTGSLVVRRDIDPSEPRTTLVLDREPGAWMSGAFEDGVEVAASVVHALAVDNLPTSLFDASSNLHEMEGGRMILDALAEVDEADGHPFVETASAAASGDGGLVVLVTGDEVRGAAAATVAAANASVALVVIGPGRVPKLEHRPGHLAVEAPSASAACAVWTGLR